MRALTWLLGVMLILIGFGHGGPNSSGWTAVWIGAAVLWFFVGCGLGVLTLSKFVAGKTGGGLNAALGPRSQRVPPPEAKE